MLRRFLLTNFLVVSVCVGAWQAGLLEWMAQLPRTSWMMVGFLVLVWASGLVFVAMGRHKEVFHAANLLPMLGLLGTIIGVQLSGAAIHEMSPEAAFTLFRGIILAMPMTAISLFLMVWLRELQFWCSREHV